ncbi:MAG: hypothetical protein KDC38_18850, partial [Planctomycetes bacterium]|nr:hypothetical protein [Planctomycetota bacterium]
TGVTVPIAAWTVAGIGVLFGLGWLLRQTDASARILGVTVAIIVATTTFWLSWGARLEPDIATRALVAAARRTDPGARLIAVGRMEPSLDFYSDRSIVYARGVDDPIFEQACNSDDEAWVFIARAKSLPPRVQPGQRVGRFAVFTRGDVSEQAGDGATGTPPSGAVEPAPGAQRGGASPR